MVVFFAPSVSNCCYSKDGNYKLTQDVQIVRHKNSPGKFGKFLNFVQNYAENTVYSVVSLISLGVLFRLTCDIRKDLKDSERINNEAHEALINNLKQKIEVLESGTEGLNKNMGKLEESCAKALENIKSMKDLAMKYEMRTCQPDRLEND